jgi:hypothetical protein
MTSHTDEWAAREVARRIRGPLRAAGRDGLTYAQIRAIADFGWSREQIADALRLVSAVPLPGVVAGERWRLAPFDPDALLPDDARATIAADARQRGLAVREDGETLRVGTARIEYAEDWAFLLVDLVAVAA